MSNQPKLQHFTVGFLLFIVLHVPPWILQGQTLPTGTPYFEDALRRLQLTSHLNRDVSFMIKPIVPRKAFGIDDFYGTLASFPDSVQYPTNAKLSGYETGDIIRGAKAGQSDSLGFEMFRLTLLPLRRHTRYNHHHPYGWSDGPMVPSKGLQEYTSIGFHFKLGPLELQLMPEFVYAQNKPFQNPPVRPREIDMPERMGQAPYDKFFLGQSYLRLNIGPFAAGYSSENIWYGPGIKNSIVLTNNAPGFRHFSFMTNRPFRTPIGSFEAHMAAGRLHRSGFKWPLQYDPEVWPPIAGDVVPDTVHGTEAYGYANTMALVWQPRWIQGLFIGSSRAVQAMGDPANFVDYFRVIYYKDKIKLVPGIGFKNPYNRNQLISLFFRYLFLESSAEVYGEIGREDFWADIEDLLVRLQYSTAFNLGFRKIYKYSRPHNWFELSAEYTHLRAPLANYSRSSTGGYSFYTHSTNFGWTHYGQVLGAGIGPGSTMLTFGLRRGFRNHIIGLQLERVSYNEDLFYTSIPFLRLGSGANPFFVDMSKNFVDVSTILSMQSMYKRLHIGLYTQLLKTFNFQWNYDPNGQPGPFRFPGINLWSLNSELSLMYRF